MTTQQSPAAQRFLGTYNINWFLTEWLINNDGDSFDKYSLIDVSRIHNGASISFIFKITSDIDILDNLYYQLNGTIINETALSELIHYYDAPLNEVPHNLFVFLHKKTDYEYELSLCDQVITKPVLKIYTYISEKKLYKRSLLIDIPNRQTRTDITLWE